jgi:hypothetical protein
MTPSLKQRASVASARCTARGGLIDNDGALAVPALACP